MRLNLIHPSRGRPHKSMETVRKWIKNATKTPEFIISLDIDDPCLPEYEKMYVNMATINKNRSAIDAINNAAKVAPGDVFMVVSDDTDCPEGWDSFLLKWLDGKSDFVAKTQDGIQNWIITNPIMDRTYYNRFGYIYHPDYKHMFCDTELTCVADLLGRKLTSNVLFKHLKYNQEPDAISKRADGTWDQGEKLFLERYKRNFDLPPDQIKGKIQDISMINWLQRKVRR